MKTLAEMITEIDKVQKKHDAIDENIFNQIRDCYYENKIFTPSQVLKIAAYHKAEPGQVRRALIALGFKSVPKWVGGKTMRVWSRGSNAILETKTLRQNPVEKEISKTDFLRSLSLADGFFLSDEKERTGLYQLARQAGIKITTRKHADGRILVTRIK